MAVFEFSSRSTTTWSNIVSNVAVLFLCSCSATDYNVTPNGESRSPFGSGAVSAGSRGDQLGTKLSSQGGVAGSAGATVVAGGTDSVSTERSVTSTQTLPVSLLELDLGGGDGAGSNGRGGTASSSPSGGRSTAADIPVGGSVASSSIPSLGGSAQASSSARLAGGESGGAALTRGGSSATDSAQNLGGLPPSSSVLSFGGAANSSVAQSFGGGANSTLAQVSGAAGTGVSASLGGAASSIGASNAGGVSGSSIALSSGGTVGSSAVPSAGGTSAHCSVYTDLGALTGSTNAISPIPASAICYRFRFSNTVARFQGLQMNGCGSARTASVNGTAVCSGDCWKATTISSAVDGYWYLSVAADTGMGCAVSWWWN